MPATSHIAELREILPTAQIITSHDLLLAYSADASNIVGLPNLVTIPGNTEEVKEILKWANRNQIPVVPRGSGTGVTGGCVPHRGGVVISMARMDKIIEIDKKNMIAEVEPGVVTGDFQRAVEKEGLFYPPDPSSLNVCTIGGNIAENAGGPRAIKYGVTRDYCLSLEAVLPNADIVNTGSRALKSVVGYDLTRLLIGSEGTLAIFTKIILKLIPKPEKTITMRIYLSSIENATDVINTIFDAGLIPSMVELLDKASIKCASQYLKCNYPDKTAAMLILEIDGYESGVKLYLQRIKEILKRYPVLDLEIAGNDDERENILQFRRSISPAIYQVGSKKINEDICVPRSKLAECFKGLERIAQKYDLNMVNFGHGGDGNIHINIMIEDTTDNRGGPEIDMKNKKGYEASIREIFRMALMLGGSISGEHGIGLTKAPYLNMEIGPTSNTLMQQIKGVFDPDGLMNPGKIFS